MVDPTPIRRPVNLHRTSLRTDEAEREEQERLNTEDAYILRTGFVISPPEKGMNGWKCKVVKNILGN